MDPLYFLHDKGNGVMRGVHVHRRHEIYYIVKGKTKYVVGGEIYTVEEGGVAFTPKSTYHMTECGAHLNTERYLISFDEAVFDEITHPILDELSTNYVTTIPINKREELERLFASLERASELTGPLAEAEKKILVLSVLLYVCRNSRRCEPHIVGSEKLIHSVSEYVRSHYSEDINLYSLAKKFSLSESYLSRKFKDLTGVGVNEYLTFIRIMNAERILMEGKYSITDVSAKVGFNDPNYFSTVFKRIKGVSPLKFSKGQLHSDSNEQKNGRSAK